MRGIPNDPIKERERANKIRLSKIGVPRSEETKRKLSIAHTGKKLSEETRKKMSASRIGDKNPNYGKRGKLSPIYGRTPSEEERKKISEWKKQNPISEEYRLKLIKRLKEKPIALGKKFTEEHRRKLSIAHSGERGSNWKGGISFEPYCEKFNKEFKNRVRAFFNYKCFICGSDGGKKKLCVHHVTYNKKTCCDGTRPLFVAICNSCHSITSNTNREYWEKYFIDRIMTELDGKCYFTKEEFYK